MTLGFTKMHGAGNDFVVIDNMAGRVNLSKEQIAFLCDRHKGIGADGLILVESAADADCFMNYYNQDGTEAEMCGNGVRCTAKFLEEHFSMKKENFKIGTRAGIKEIKKEDQGNFSVNMGKPVFTHQDFPDKEIELEKLKLSFVSMGNPHAVAFVKDIEAYELEKIGPAIEKDKNFPNKINLELVEEISPREFKVKVWERGSGATLACGTGACAVYATALRIKDNMKKDEEVKISLPGGDLFLSENENGEIIMRGPAKSVYSGLVEVL